MLHIYYNCTRENYENKIIVLTYNEKHNIIVMHLSSVSMKFLMCLLPLGVISSESCIAMII